MNELPLPMPQPDGIGLLDILDTLAENLKLLILGPLAAGLLALGLCFVWPKTFESVAVLQADPAIASFMTTVAVLDTAVQSLSLRKDITLEESREELRSRIKTSVGRNDKLLTLSVSGETPAKARATASALLDAIYVQSKPRGSQKAKLEKQLLEAQTRLNTAQTTSAQLARSMGAALAGPSRASRMQHTECLDMLAVGSAGLLEASAAAQKQIVELEIQLEGLTDSQLVQAPTLPENPARPDKRKIVAMAVLGSGLLLLVFVFFRSGMRSIKDSERLVKLSRIRRSLGLSPR